MALLANLFHLRSLFGRASASPAFFFLLFSFFTQTVIWLAKLLFVVLHALNYSLSQKNCLLFREGSFCIGLFLFFRIRFRRFLLKMQLGCFLLFGSGRH